MLPGVPAPASAGPTLVAGGYVPGTGVTSLGPAPADAPMTVLVGLPSRDPGGFAAYETAAYIPGTGAYRQFLTPAQVSARFGASPATVASATSYFGAEGLATHVSPDGLLMTITGTTSSVGHAFETTFDAYRASDGREFVGHPGAATLPASVPVDGVYGLGNVTQPQPLGLVTDNVRNSATPSASCSTGPEGLSPCQIWGAYDTAGLIANGTNGAGERIAIVDSYDAGEPQTQLESDLSSFDSTFDLPSPSVTYNYPVPTTQNLNATYTGWAVEEALDLEWSHASAPGASIAMTFAPNSGVGLYEAVDWLVANHLANVISLSWGEPDVGVFNAYSGACQSECNATSDGSYEVLGPVLEAAAVEGIGVFVATGDCGASDGTSGVSTDYPSSDPAAVAVGGTYLSVSSSGVWEGEVAWSGNSSGQTSPGCQNQGGSGGGYSPFPRPYWQSGTGVPSTPDTRGTPDVSADASNGVTVVQGGGEGSVGGTSLATPLWAGFAAIIDQHAGRALGDLDPSVYSVLRGTNYSTDFHDITSGNNGYSAGVGWDPVTGVGTPNVANLMVDLTTPHPYASTLRALLYANQTSGAAGLSVRFGIAATGGSGAYPLEGVYFGDGTSALASDGIAEHTYPDPGVYPAVAFVADSSGNWTTSYPVAIVVGGGPLNVTLRLSTDTPTVGASVTFTPSASGGTSPYQYLYYFGDGTYVNFTAATSLTHSFTVSGSYCAEVVAEDSAHPTDGARSNPVPIAVGGGPLPVCSNASEPLAVEAIPTPGVRDAPADFPSLFQIVGGVTGVDDAGVTETWASSDPYVAACQCTIFRAPGTYSVSLSVTDLLDDHASNATFVTVAPALAGTFTASTQYGVAPLTVQFGVTLVGGYGANPNSTHWTFGDGAGATGASVTEVYTAPGLYTATGDATDLGQGNASRAFLIDVLPSASPAVPVLTATFAPAVNLSSGTTVAFDAAAAWSNGTPMDAQFHWGLGANGSAWGNAAAETYLAVHSGPLQYLDATVTAYWSDGSAPTEADLVSPQLFAIETGGFTPNASALRLSASGGPATLEAGGVWSGSAVASAPSGIDYNWSFGDNTSSDSASVAHTYDDPGNYTSEVFASDPWNDTALHLFGVSVAPQVIPPIVVSGGPSVESGVAPLRVSFTASATGGVGPHGFEWYTGDGTVGYNGTFNYTYTTPGTYHASVVVSDALDDRAQLNWTIVVSASPAGPGTTGLGSGYLYLVIGAVVGVLAGVAAVVADRRRRPPVSPSPRPGA